MWDTQVGPGSPDPARLGDIRPRLGLMAFSLPASSAPRGRRQAYRKQERPAVRTCRNRAQLRPTESRLIGDYD